MINKKIRLSQRRIAILHEILEELIGRINRLIDEESSSFYVSLKENIDETLEKEYAYILSLREKESEAVE